MTDLMSQVTTRDWRQEWYPTGSPEIRRRANALRWLNVTGHVANMGQQVTQLGRMRMSLLDIRRNGAAEGVWDAVMGVSTQAGSDEEDEARIGSAEGQMDNPRQEG